MLSCTSTCNKNSASCPMLDFSKRPILTPTFPPQTQQKSNQRDRKAGNVIFTRSFRQPQHSKPHDVALLGLSTRSDGYVLTYYYVSIRRGR